MIVQEVVGAKLPHMGIITLFPFHHRSTINQTYTFRSYLKKFDKILQFPW